MSSELVTNKRKHQQAHRDIADGGFQISCFALALLSKLEDPFLWNGFLGFFSVQGATRYQVGPGQLVKL